MRSWPVVCSYPLIVSYRAEETMPNSMASYLQNLALFWSAILNLHKVFVLFEENFVRLVAVNSSSIHCSFRNILKQTTYWCQE